MRRRREGFGIHARSPSLALGGGAVLVVALLFASRRLAAPPKPRGPVVDSDANCETIRTRYRGALTPFQVCTGDDQCVAETRGGVRSGLDGCARFRRADAKLGDLVDPLEEAWLGRGCAQRFMTCSAPRRAQCKAGTCAELPPAPVPRAWNRVEHVGFGGTRFSFFVPPGLERQDVIGDDSEVGAFRGPRYELDYDYGEYSNTLVARPEEGETALHSEAVTVDGVSANLGAMKTRDGLIISGVHFPVVPSAGRGTTGLTLYARCKSLLDCAEVSTIARSIEFH